MTAHSGKFGVVNNVSTMRNWTLNDLQESKPFVASNTQGGTGRQEGVRDWNGTFGAYGGVPFVMPGDLFSFFGYTAPDDDIEGGVGTTYQGPAIVDSIALTLNLATTEIVSHTVNFSGNGGLLITDEDAALLDLTPPDVPAAVQTKLEVETGEGTDVFEPWQCWTQAVLTITAANQPTVNSCGVFNGKLYRLRKPGNIDWTLAITEDHTKRDRTAGDPIPQLAEDLIYKLYINATEFYELKWGHLENYSSINVDREGGTIINRTANVGMNGFADGGGTGHILLPDTSQYWPRASQPTTTTTTTT